MCVFYHVRRVLGVRDSRSSFPPAHPMTLFACFPVCLTFVSIAIIGVIVVVFGLSNRVSPDERAALAESTPQAPAKLPPLWVFPVVLLILTVLMLVLAWYWPE